MQNSYRISDLQPCAYLTKNRNQDLVLWSRHTIHTYEDRYSQVISRSDSPDLQCVDLFSIRMEWLTKTLNSWHKVKVISEHRFSSPFLLGNSLLSWSNVLYSVHMKNIRKTYSCALNSGSGSPESPISVSTGESDVLGKGCVLCEALGLYGNSRALWCSADSNWS